MSQPMIPRRRFVAGAALGAASAALGLPRGGSATAPWHPANDGGAVKLGVASYSLRKLSRDEAIAAIKELGTPYVNIKSFHLPYELSPAELRAGAREFEAAGLKIVGGGTITFKEDTDEEVRKYFEYAKHAGMPLMVATAAPEILPRIEKFAKRYGIKVAIHNHGPEDRYYPSSYDVLKYIGNMDPVMGVCLDVGHAARAGVDVVEAIVDAGPRLLDMHMKDLASFQDKDSQVAVGEGQMPVAQIFKTLAAIDYPGYVNLEYEIHAENPLPGMKQSFAYMRGALAGLEAGGGIS